MPTINFYRQFRRDGGFRTGVEVDGESVLMQFDPGDAGGDEPDPRLVWYVDVSCRGGSLPREVGAVRRWLLRHEAGITRTIHALAKSVPQGIDPSDWPLRKEAKIGLVKLAVTCSVVRRLEAQRVSEILRDVADKWTERLTALPELQPS
jgi:hypothetical protein